jgi:hypothetical protein
MTTNILKVGAEPVVQAIGYADLKTALSNEGWDCSLYLMEVGARAHILKSVKDPLRS